MIAKDLSKQQALDADPRAIQQTNFTANLEKTEGANVLYYWKSKRNYFGLFTRNRKSFVSVINCE